ncbi:MAG: hypothetical protein QNJ51_11070 [Calothrix sp. MO_167.B12]|nr:hypothetical protein [Calothrix sp. MO_167.B12]
MLAIENTICIRNYDSKQFPFYEIFSGHCLDTISCQHPHLLHEYIADNLKPNKILKVGEDQATYAHSILYQIDPQYQKNRHQQNQVKDRGFIKTYQNFISFLEESFFGEKLVYQKLPTLRIHFPNNLSVGEYHRDRDYNHPMEEINIWVPITTAKRTATIHMESSFDRGDFHPIELEYGQYLIFDSALKHGNEINVEGYSRVSFDFRVIPLSKYKQSEGKSINQNMKFAIGDYYQI